MFFEALATICAGLFAGAAILHHLCRASGPDSSVETELAATQFGRELSTGGQ